MVTKGIKGAVTVEENTAEAIQSATIELLAALVKANDIKTGMISHVIFTLTEDLNAAFPAKFARLDMGWNDAAMMCFHELNVPNSLPKCLRVLIVLNCETSFKPKFCYLKDAKNLRR